MEKNGFVRRTHRPGVLSIAHIVGRPITPNESAVILLTPCQASHARKSADHASIVTLVKASNFVANQKR